MPWALPHGGITPVFGKVEEIASTPPYGPPQTRTGVHDAAFKVLIACIVASEIFGHSDRLGCKSWPDK